MAHGATHALAMQNVDSHWFYKVPLAESPTSQQGATAAGPFHGREIPAKSLFSQWVSPVLENTCSLLFFGQGDSGQNPLFLQCV